MQTLRNDTNTFYDAIADHYHLFFRDWQATVQREGSALRRIFREHAASGHPVAKVLDASCGTGTQSIALAQLHYAVTAADPSFNMVMKASDHARDYGVSDDITFVRSGFLELPYAVVGPYDAVMTKGNALPHLLTDAEIMQALHNFYDLLRPGGLVLIGMRDFDFLLEDRPRFVPRHLHTDEDDQDVILFDVWEWADTDPVTVTFNTFIVMGSGDRYEVTKYPVVYRALRTEEIETMLADAGFTDIKTAPQGWEILTTATRPA